MKENTINLNEIDLNNQTALSILTAASKAIAYEEDTVNIDLMIDAAIRYLQDTNTMLKELQKLTPYTVAAVQGSG